ncbi:MAG: MOFRL family protein, partial [Gemmatimonadota bacterium]
QELALAAAEVLAEWKGPGRVALLAAGTDGRDGPTDAAGAVVDETTWETVRRAGHDPEPALRRHDAHPALEGAGALLRTGMTGTNVMDVVIGWGAAADADVSAEESPGESPSGSSR